MPKLRAGSDAAARLLASDSLQEWAEAFESYDESVKRLSQEKGRAGLVELDRWWREDLTAALGSRGADPYLTKEELVKIVQWKLWIGVVRPNLLRFASETNPQKVKAKSREAFRLLRPPSETSEHATRVPPAALRKAVTALTSDLKGVGPATASAVLAALCGGCPFDADEVIDAVMKTGVRKYSLPEYLQIAETLDSKAGSLGTPWDAERVRKALWSRAMHSRFDLTVTPASPAVSTSKRKAAIPADASVGVRDASEGKGGVKVKKGRTSSAGENKQSGGAKRRKSSR